MAYQVLARKWRPKTFKEMVGQEHVLRALINALDENRLHHAYLFTGTRGVGKTTIARIIAKSLNCEQGVSASPCCVCSTCQEVDEGRFVDLIEVDAASRTKVEDTRELLENVQYAPTRGRYKVYLIDEVHMLSTSSFNALLKTLEEPPEHVKFLLATTDPQKLPATVLSRCLQFNLKRMPMDQIIAHHKHILGEENIEYEDTALSLIARAADGSMRDSLSLLDQSIAFGHGKVMQADVATMLGSISYDFIAHIIQALSANDGDALMAVVEQLSERAPDFLSVLNELVTILHQLALVKRIPDAVDESLMDKAQLMALADGLSEADIQLLYQIGLMGKRDLPLAPNTRTGFEMVLLRMLAFAPNAHSAPPADTTGGHARGMESAPVKKPETQQVGHSSAVAPKIALEHNESKSAEYLAEKTVLHGVGDDAPVIQNAKPEQKTEQKIEQKAEQNVIEKSVQVPPQHASEPPIKTPSDSGVQALEKTGKTPVENTTQTLDNTRHNPVKSDTGDSPDASQSRVARRAEMRALRAQEERNNQRALPSAIAHESHVSPPLENLKTDALKNRAPKMDEVATETTTPPVTAPTYQSSQYADEAFTPEQLAVYEEYAGMSDDDDIGYDLALDDMSYPEVAGSLVNLPPHNESSVAELIPEPDQVNTEKVEQAEASSLAENAPNHTPVEPPQKTLTKANDASQLVWFELLERVNVEGLPRQLAENCALRARLKKGEQGAEQAHIELVLNSAHETLLSEASKQALQEALSNYLGTPQNLSIQVGDTSDISETPAERKTRLFGERHNHAVEAIMQDPNVVIMQSLFGATVDTSLIKPIELNA